MLSGLTTSRVRSVTSFVVEWVDAVSENVGVSSITMTGSSTTGLMTPIVSDRTDLYTQISKTVQRRRGGVPREFGQDQVDHQIHQPALVNILVALHRPPSEVREKGSPAFELC